MTASIFDAIGAGDLVEVGDADHNLVRGPVHLSDGDTLAVAAFGVLIPFARRNRNKTWVATQGVKLVGHQPPLDLELIR